MKEKIKKYREYYRKLLTAAGDAGLKVFISTDVLFDNENIRKFTGDSFKRRTEFFIKAIESLFSEFGGISGLIVRIGESDGLDVKGDFRSRLLIKTPEQANDLLKNIIPVFEKYGKDNWMRSQING